MLLMFINRQLAIRFCQMCRFACRYEPFCTLKRPVLHCHTARFANRLAARRLRLQPGRLISVPRRRGRPRALAPLRRCAHCPSSGQSVSCVLPSRLNVRRWNGVIPNVFIAFRCFFVG